MGGKFNQMVKGLVFLICGLISVSNASASEEGIFELEMDGTGGQGTILSYKDSSPKKKEEASHEYEESFDNELLFDMDDIPNAADEKQAPGTEGSSLPSENAFNTPSSEENEDFKPYIGRNKKTPKPHNALEGFQKLYHSYREEVMGYRPALPEKNKRTQAGYSVPAYFPMLTQK